MRTKRIVAWAVGLALFLALAGCAGPGPGTGDPATLSVNGQARTTVAPDRGEFWVTVATRGEDSTIQAENAERTQAVRDAMREAGAGEDSIKTQGISFHPVYRWIEKDGENRIDGYEASHQLLVTIEDLGTIGAIMDSTIRAGAQSVGGVSFQVSDETLREAHTLLVIEAVEEAYAKAQRIAEAAGETIDGVQYLYVHENYQEPIHYRDVGMGGAPEDTITPVDPKDLTVQASVSVTYRLK